MAKLTPEYNLLVKFPEVAAEWSYDLNHPVKPENCMPGSNARKWWWICKQGHYWEATINDRTSHSCGCPYCSGRYPTPTTCLEATYPELCKELHPSNVIKPSDVSAHSAKKMLWTCNICNETWTAAVFSRTKGSRCPYCKGDKVGSKNNFKILFPEIADEWDYELNHPHKPEDCLPSSGKRKWWWHCKKCLQKWQTRIDHRTSSKSGCPNCNESKGERLINKLLKESNINFSRQYCIYACRTTRPLPFDFAIHGKKLGLIEFQGIQHYKPIELFGGEQEFKRSQLTDQLKLNYCAKNSIPLLVIPYTEKHIPRLIENFLSTLMAPEF